MDNQGVYKASLGIRYLIKYAKNANPVYFSVIKECILEIKLWCILTMFINNMDDLWEEVPDFIYEDMFLMRDFGSKVNYGRGYQTNSKLSFKEQFKIIRNKLAHQEFTFCDGMIYLDDGFSTHFDLLWLEMVVMQTISNQNNQFKKRMSDIGVLALGINGENSTLDFKKMWQSGFIQFYRVTLLNGDKKTVADKFDFAKISAEHYTFDLLFQAVKSKLSMIKPNLLIFLNQEYLHNMLNEIEKYFEHVVKLDFVVSDQFESIILEKDFENLSFKGKLQYLVNKIKFEDSYSYNSIVVHQIIDILNDAQDDIFDQDKLIIMKDSVDFLLKVYANILFANVYCNKNSVGKYNIAHQFSMDVHFEHAKNVYQDYIRVLKRAYDETEEHYTSTEYREKILALYHEYCTLLDEVMHNEYDKRLFWNMRNAIVHNQIEFNQHQVHLYTIGRKIYLKHFNKKKKSWVEKEFKNNQTIWEMTMDKEDFLRMLDALYRLEDISIQINISKLIRRKEKGL